MERRLWLAAIPSALAVAWLFMQADIGRSVSRVFLTMWIHELGHAVAAWFCGYAAVPGPWFTRVPESRSFVFVLLCAGLLGYAAFAAWRRGSRVLPAICGAVFGLQLFMTLGVGPYRARELWVFAGDGGLFVLGALLMGTVYAPEESKLRKNWLCWGFLVIGAFAFMDGWTTWRTAAADPETIMFGQNVGSGDSDPTVLVDEFGWSVKQLVSRYTTLGWVCLLGLAGLYAWGALRRRGSEQDG